jgi:hypothetical protein
MRARRDLGTTEHDQKERHMSDQLSLADVVTGPVFTAGPEFAAELAAFNLAVTHLPEVVVGAVDAADVVATVRWAAERGLPVAVQATGHGAIAPYDRGVVVSTARMERLEIDPATRLATIGAGVRWRAVIDAAARHGLAPLNGSSSGVGVVGYTLGGGMPVLGRTFGFASDWVRSFEVVTADGVVRRVSADHEPELFFALRGGKPTAGIVTEMVMELVPVSEVYGGSLFVDGSHAAAMFATYRTWTPTLPDGMTTALKLLRLPPLPDVPEPLRNRLTVQLSAAYVGDPREGERLLAPMRECAPPIIDQLRRLPYPEVDTVHYDPQHPVPVLPRCGLFDVLTPAAVEDLLASLGPGVDTPVLMAELRHLGGAMGRDLDDAVGPRDSAYSLLLLGVPAPGLQEAVGHALISIEQRLAPHLNGRTFVNMQGAALALDDQLPPWSARIQERLDAVTHRYDPTGVFRFGPVPRQPVATR